jgi:hypothetical protein
LQASQVHISPDIAADDLPPGVHASVGPARARQLDGVAQVPLEGVRQGPADRRLARL